MPATKCPLPRALRPLRSGAGRGRPFACRLVAAVAISLLLGAGPAAAAKRMVVLGIDGMDPRLLERYMGEGALPNFSRLAAEGDFAELQTAVAPQSPVAWSNFITGMDPSGHGIFDFVHRDPETLVPYMSMSRAHDAARTLAVGSWVIPLAGGSVELLRKGRAFWELLGEHGVPTNIFRMPVNFPPVAAPGSRQISGMGTPDLLGTSGTFSYYTEILPENAEDFTGGKAYEVEVLGGLVETKVHGPDNPFRRVRTGTGEAARSEAAPLTADLRVRLDRENRTALIEVGETALVLAEKEWSDWVEVRFAPVPGLVEVSATARFYLRQVSPLFQLYLSPLQINPADPVMPISSPAGWSKELCSCVGYFHTQELPHDTKAFTNGVFDGREFWDQLVFLNEEAERIFLNLLARHEEGLLFFYFGSVDQGSHMLWHLADEAHPNFRRDDFLAGGIRRTYERMDRILGEVLATIDEDTALVVMSDHGFAPFYRGVNLNTWLLERGYLALRDPADQGAVDLFAGVDWTRTEAYALGLNGVYLNLRGREKDGSVAPEDYERTLDRLERDLLALRDPGNGAAVVTRVVRPRRDMRGPERGSGPDLIVGYNWGYRSSWESPLGKFPPDVLVDNRQPWSGDHCIDSRLVPGVLLANRPITLAAPSLVDLTVAILDEFGVAPLPEMLGRDCLGDALPPDGSRP